MLKRICDRCGKEIKDDAPWFRFKVDKMKYEYVFCSGGHFELCEHCWLLFKKDFANKT
jgi:hypothetical protein